jgi:NAD(P)-dependent dehydrogenase (short-subunit alcohol dehydrogenase family)
VLTRPLALVTGASSGIGRELATELRAFGAKVQVVPCDLSSPDGPAGRFATERTLEQDLPVVCS